MVKTLIEEKYVSLHSLAAGAGFNVGTSAWRWDMSHMGEYL